MAATLGWQFLDKNGEKLLLFGEKLIYVKTTIPPQYLNDLELKAVFPIAQKPSTLQEALASTAENLEKRLLVWAKCCFSSTPQTLFA